MLVLVVTSGHKLVYLYYLPIPNGIVRFFFKVMSPVRYLSGLNISGSSKTVSSCKTDAILRSTSVPAGIVYKIKECNNGPNN